MFRYEAELLNCLFSLLNHTVLCVSSQSAGEQMDELDLMYDNGRWSRTIAGRILSYSLVNHLSEFGDQQTTGLGSSN
jgi:hypothetical protein